VHGFVRATKDLDIVPNPAPENLARLARVLVDIEAQHVGVGISRSSAEPEVSLGERPHGFSGRAAYPPAAGILSG
jgi:hypothetical protein